MPTAPGPASAHLGAPGASPRPPQPAAMVPAGARPPTSAGAPIRDARSPRKAAKAAANPGVVQGRAGSEESRRGGQVREARSPAMMPLPCQSAAPRASQGHVEQGAQATPPDPGKNMPWGFSTGQQAAQQLSLPLPGSGTSRGVPRQGANRRHSGIPRRHLLPAAVAKFWQALGQLAAPMVGCYRPRGHCGQGCWLPGLPPYHRGIEVARPADTGEHRSLAIFQPGDSCGGRSSGYGRAWNRRCCPGPDGWHLLRPGDLRRRRIHPTPIPERARQVGPQQGRTGFGVSNTGSWKASVAGAAAQDGQSMQRAAISSTRQVSSLFCEDDLVPAGPTRPTPVGRCRSANGSRCPTWPGGAVVTMTAISLRRPGVLRSCGRDPDFSHRLTSHAQRPRGRCRRRI